MSVKFPPSNFPAQENLYPPRLLVNSRFYDYSTRLVQNIMVVCSTFSLLLPFLGGTQPSKVEITNQTAHFYLNQHEMENISIEQYLYCTAWITSLIPITVQLHILQT